MAQNLGDLVVRIVGDNKEFDASISATEKRFKSAADSMIKIGKSLTTFVTLPIIGLGVAAVKSAADMEMQQAAFTTMLGSATKAKDMLAELVVLAAKTPFAMPDLAQASKTLLQFGIESSKIIPTLKMLGDVAGGNSQKLGSLALVFGQIQSTGRLMGQDLLQLINVGFNPLKVIADKTGKSMGELKKEMEKGAISADMVTEAFKSATSEGGLFFNGMETASQTFSGLMSTMMDDVGAVGRSFGEILLPALKDVVKDISAFAQNFNALDTDTKKFILTLAGLVAGIGPVFLGFGQLMKGVLALKAAFVGLTASSAILIGLYAVASAALLIANGMKQAKVQAENLQNALKGVGDEQQFLDAIEKQREIAESAARAATFARTAESKKGLTELAKAEQAKLDLLWENLRALRLKIELERLDGVEAERAAAAEAEALKKSLAARSEIVASAAENEIGTTTDTVSQVDRIRREQYENYVKIRDQMAELDKEFAEEEKQRAEKLAKDKVAAWETSFDAIKSLINNLVALSQATADAQISILEKQLSTELDALKVKHGIETEELSEFEKEKAALELDFEKKIADIRYKAELDSWKAQVLVATADTIAAVVKTMTSLPWPINIIPAGIQAAAGATQLAALAKSKPQPPAFAMGTESAPGGTALVGEQGPEMVNIPRGSKIFNAAETSSMLSRIPGGGVDGGMITIITNIDSKPILKAIFPATKNRIVLIDQGAVV